jgi:hypothetical protein
MYQPYPTGAQMPTLQPPSIPPQVANAVKVMYVGAAASLLGIIVDILTVNATKTAIERRSPKFTVSQVNLSQHTLIIGFVLGGVIATAVWIFLARACRGGKNWARITGTVLFGLSTVDTIVGITAPLAGTVKIWGAVVWLIALIAVVFLWQRKSTAFFKAVPQ